jgi:hypothetical protein
VSRGERGNVYSAYEAGKSGFSPGFLRSGVGEGSDYA